MDQAPTPKIASTRAIASCAVGVMYAIMLDYQRNVLMRGEPKQKFALNEELYQEALNISSDCALRLRTRERAHADMLVLVQTVDGLLPLAGLERLIFDRHRELMNESASGATKRYEELDAITAELKPIAVAALYDPWREQEKPEKWVRVDRTEATEISLALIRKVPSDAPEVMRTQELNQVQKELNKMMWESAKRREKTVELEMLKQC